MMIIYINIVCDRNNPTWRRILVGRDFCCCWCFIVIVVVIVVVVVGRVRRAIPIRRACRRRRPRHCHLRAQQTRLPRFPGRPVPDLPVSWPIWSSERVNGKTDLFDYQYLHLISLLMSFVSSLRYNVNLIFRRKKSTDKYVCFKNLLLN